MMRHFFELLRSQGTEFRQRSMRARFAVLCAAASIAICTTGCAELPATDKAEIAWQALNVVDAGQTVTIGRQPRYHEDRADAFIGAHPSERDVYLFMAGEAALHFAVTRWFEYEGWDRASAIWQTVTISEKGFNVAHNAHIGIDLWGPQR